MFGTAARFDPYPHVHTLSLLEPRNFTCQADEHRRGKVAMLAERFVNAARRGVDTLKGRVKYLLV